MTGDQDPETDGHSLETFTRRTVLRLAGLVGLFSRGAAAETAGGDRASATATPRAVATARRTAALEGSLGQFAEAVAVNGTTALVGVPPAASTAGPTTGRVVALERDGGAWTRRATIRPDGDDGQFGRAVALNSETVAVGAELGADPTGDHAGTVAVFAPDSEGLSRQATLRAPNTSGVDRFGCAVDVDSDRVLVGASAANRADGGDSGAAFEFTHSDGAWQHVATLAPSTAECSQFGCAVALDGDTAVVGAERLAGGGRSDADTGGVAHVYRRVGETWRRVTDLVSPAGHRGDGFGSVLAVDGRTLVVGAPGEATESGPAAGRVHVFERHAGEYHRVATLQSRDGGPAERFGAALALDGGVVLVATRSGDRPQVFGRTRDGWAAVGVLQATRDAPAGRRTAVALDGSCVVVGAGPGEEPNEAAGSVEVFEP